MVSNHLASVSLGVIGGMPLAFRRSHWGGTAGVINGPRVPRRVFEGRDQDAARPGRGASRTRRVLDAPRVCWHVAGSFRDGQRRSSSVATARAAFRSNRRLHLFIKRTHQLLRSALDRLPSSPQHEPHPSIIPVIPHISQSSLLALQAYCLHPPKPQRGLERRVNNKYNVC